MARRNFDFGDGSLVGLWRLGDELPIQPDHLDGLVGWYEADSLLLSDTDPISTWADSGPAGNDATGSGSSRPIFKTSIIGSLPVVRFDGIDDVLTVSGLVNFGDSSTDDMTLFVVSKASSAHYGGIVGTRNGGGGTAGWQLRYDNSATSMLYYHTSQTPNNTITLASDAFHIISVSRANLVYNYYEDGAIDSNDTKSGITAATNPVSLGYGGGSPLDGDIAEVIIFNRTLDDCEQRGVEVYLAEKFSFSPLSLQGSGTSSPEEVKDRSGAGNHGTRDVTTLSPGHFGQGGGATKIDSADGDGVGCGGILDSTFGGADKKFSFSFFVKTGDLSTAQELWINKYDTTGDQRQFLVRGQTDGTLEFLYYGVGTGGTYRGISPSETLANNTQYYIVVTYDGSIDSAAEDRCEFYINGVLGTSKAVTATGGSFPFDIPTSTAHLGLGAYYNSSGTRIGTSGNFELTEVGIYNRVLTQDEISIIVFATSDPVDHLATLRYFPGIINYWPLGCYGQQDIVGALHGTAVGSLTNVEEHLQYATSFNGTSRIQLGDVLEDITVGPNAQFTFCCWIKADATQVGTYGMILSKEPGGWYLWWRSSNVIEFLWYDNDVTGYWGRQTTATFTSDKWYFVVVEYDGTKVYSDRNRIWINGINQTLANGDISGVPVDIANVTTETVIGSSDGADTYSFEGEIGPVFVVSGLVTTVQIIDYYEGLLAQGGILSHQFGLHVNWFSSFPTSPTTSGFYPKVSGLYNTSSGLANSLEPTSFNWNSEIELALPSIATNEFRTTSVFGSYRRPLVGRSGS